MDRLSSIFENDTSKSCEDAKFCWSDFFRDAATQVDENDLLQEGRGEYLATENSPPGTEICATGVAGTPIVGNSAQVFGTARLNTEPRLTFVFPSMRSAFDQQEDTSGLSSISDSNKLFHNVYPTSLPSVTPQSLTSLHVISSPTMSSSTVTSVTMASVTVASAKVTAVTMTFPAVTSVTMTTIASSRKTSSMKLPPIMTVIGTSLHMTSPSMTSPSMTRPSMTSPSMTSLPMTSPPMTSYRTSSDAVLTSTLFFPNNGVDFSNSSKRLSPKLSRSRHLNRSSLSLSPRLSLKQFNNRETAAPSPSPLRRGGSSDRSMDTGLPTRSGAHSQSREQTSDMTSLEKNQISADTTRHSIGLPSPGKHPRGKSPRGKSPQEQITSENGTLGKSTLEKGVIEEHLSESNSRDKYLQEDISSEHNAPETCPSEKHPLPLNGSPVKLPQDKEIDIPLLTTSEISSQSAQNLETSKTGSTCPEMTATSSTAGREDYPSQHSISGKKRRRTGAKSSGRGKRKKSRTMVDNKGDGRELRGTLPRRIWDGTAYKVEEVEGIDFPAELSRRTSRAGNMGRVSPNASTRLRSRKSSKVISSDDVLASDDVVPASDVINNDVISTTGGMSNDVISDSDVISSNDVISKPLPEGREESERAEMIVS